MGRQGGRQGGHDHRRVPPGTTYDLRLDGSLTDVYGQSLGQAVTHRASIVRRPTIELSSRTGTLIAPHQRTIGVFTRHVQSVAVRAAVLSDEELAGLLLDGKKHSRSAGDVMDKLPFPQGLLQVTERRYPLVPKGPTDWAALALDLAELAGDARRAILVEVRATNLVPSAAQEPAPEPARGLFRVTDLGPVVVATVPEAAVAVMRLSTRQPVAGAAVRRHYPDRGPVELGRTDAAGLVRVPGIGDWPQTAPVLLSVARPQDDRAYLQLGENEWSWRLPPERPGLRRGERLIAHLVTERGAYTPGDKVRAVGWAAVDTPYAPSGLRRFPQGIEVRFELLDPRGRTISSGVTRTSAEGKFWAELPVPARGVLGHHSVIAQLGGEKVSSYVQVQDFRVPEFQVLATTAPEELIAGQTAQVRVLASYYFGGPVKISRSTYTHSCRAHPYRPPGLDWQWRVGAEVPAEIHAKYKNPVSTALDIGEQDRLRGRAAFPVAPEAFLAPYPTRCNISVQVQDPSFQSIGAETVYLVHPARLYLAVAEPHSPYAGDRVAVPLRAVLPGGARTQAAGVRVRIERVYDEPVYKLQEGTQVFSHNQQRRELARTCTLALPAAGPDAACGFTPAHAGTYEVLASATDEAREARTQTSFHVWTRLTDETRRLLAQKPQALEIQVSRDRVVPGDQVAATVRGPWPGAAGMLVLAGGGLREVRPLTLSDGPTRFELTADDTWTPQMHLVAMVVRDGPAHLPRVDHAGTEVSQSGEHRRLQVRIEAPERARPGGQVPIVVHVRDGADRPVTARVALWATDEAVLSLTEYRVPDLLPEFIPRRRLPLSVLDDYQSLLLPYVAPDEDPWLDPRLTSGGLGTRGYGSGGGAAGYGGSASTSVTRGRFEITPLFLADLATGPDGVARATAALPDNMTTFRITAVASARLADGESPGRFGQSDTRLTVTAPLVLRPALPRLLRPGDSAEVAALVSNLGGPAGTLRISLKIDQRDGALRPLSPLVTEVPIAQGEQVRVPLQVAADRPGAAQVELSAVLTPAAGPPLTDAVRLPLPVEAERTLTERAAAYGSLADDQAAAVPIRLPAASLPGYGGLTLTASASLLGDLRDAVKALIEYPYGCVEQTLSRLLPLLVLADRGQRLSLPGGDAPAFARDGIQRLLSMQLDSGGFAYWPGGTEAHAYGSAYATWVLHLARQSGFAVSDDALARARGFLLHALGTGAPNGNDDYLDGVRRSIALHTLAEAGEPPAKLRQALLLLHGQRSRLPVFARAFLLMALGKAQKGDPALAQVAGTLTEELLGDLAETAATAHVVERPPYSLDSVFHSDGRSDAIVLWALLGTRPDHPAVAKLARGLLDRQGAGVWRNTQENAYALLALSRFTGVYERQMPNFTLAAWLDGRQLVPAGVRLSGYGAAPREVTVPMSQLLAAAHPIPLVLQRSGTGRMYYRVGLEWAEPGAGAQARDGGLAVTRALRKRSGALGEAAVLQPGEPVAVDLLVRNRTLLSYVVIDVPIPAGLEPIQRDLGRGQAAATLSGARGGFVSYEEARRDRVVLFADTLQPGTHAHTIHLRATTPGRYVLPPAVAAAMYTPEIYGRSASTQVLVR